MSFLKVFTISYWRSGAAPSVSQTIEEAGSEPILLPGGTGTEPETILGPVEQEASGRVAIANSQTNQVSKYLTRDEVSQLETASNAPAKDLVTIEKLTRLALERKDGLNKVREINLGNVLFKDIEPYFTSGYKPYDKNRSLEQAILIAPNRSGIEDLLLAACKFRIHQLAENSCRKQGLGVQERIISHKDPKSNENVPWDQLTLNKAITDLKVFEEKLKTRIAELEKRFQET